MGQCCGKEPGHIPQNQNQNQEKVPLVKNSENPQPQTGEQNEPLTVEQNKIEDHKAEAQEPSKPEGGGYNNLNEESKEQPSPSKQQAPSERNLPINYFSIELPNIDDQRVQLISSTIELMSLTKNMISRLADELSSRTEEIVPLLFQVLNSISTNSQQNPEENTRLVKYFLAENETNEYDSIDFFLHILKIINNGESLSEVDHPNYFKEGSTEIPEEISTEINEKVRSITNSNFLRNLFSLGMTTPFIQICTNPSCDNPYLVTINSEIDLFITHIALKETTIENELQERIQEKKSKSSCVSCKQSIEDYRTKGLTNVINFPTYLLVRVKREGSDDELIDSANINLEQYLNFFLSEVSYNLAGYITKNSENSYSTYKGVEGEFYDTKGSRVEEKLIQNAFVLLYKQNN